MPEIGDSPSGRGRTSQLYRCPLLRRSGTPAFVNINDVTTYHLFMHSFSIEEFAPSIWHARWPGQRFFLMAVLNSPDGRWFARGGPANSRAEWQRLVHDDPGSALMTVAEIRREQAAEILMQAGFELPADLAEAVRSSALGRNLHTNTESRAEIAPVADHSHSVPARTEAAVISPLESTLELLSRSTHATNLIRFLDQQPNRTSAVRELSGHLYKSVDKSSVAKTRLLIRRTTQTLIDRDAALRIHIDRKTGRISIIDR